MKKKLSFCKSSGSFCKIFLLISVMLSVSQSFAQEVATKVVTLDKSSVSLVDVLLDIQQQTGVNFAYEKQQLTNFKPVTIKVQKETLKKTLDAVLDGSGFIYKIAGNNIAILRGKPEQAVANVVTGRIVDEKGNPLPGATVMINGTTIGTASDGRGRFSINAKQGDVLIVSFIGYNQELLLIKEKKNVEIRLKPEVSEIEEVQVVAFGSQKKESMVGSIATVNAAQLKSSNSDLTASFAGKIAGVIGWQTGGIPGALTEGEMNTKFYIRGITSFQSNANIDPLILLDGVESSKLDLARIDPEDIETFNVLKDASATAMYGARGANGVILVTTKKGEAGSVYTSARYECITTMPTRKIEVIDPVSYMKLYNNTLLGRNPGATPRYTREQIMNTGNPKYPSFVYPSNDWYNVLFKNYTVNHHAGVNIRGGSEVVQYYASVNYNQDNGMLKTDRLNDFDCNIKSQTTTFRTNLNIDLNKGIKLVLNSFSTFDKYHGPAKDVRQAYSLAFRASPVDFAAVYPADEFYSWDHIRFGGQKKGENPYAEIHAGYTDRMRYSTINRLEYIQNLSYFVKGLEFRANASLSQEGYFTETFKNEPGLYTLKDYDFITGTHTLVTHNESGQKTLLTEAENNISTAQTRLSGDIRILHTAAWGNHQSSLTGVLQAQETRSAMPSKLFDSFPRRNLGFSARGTYGYMDKYFAEASFGYNGSERFAKDHRMGFFPAVGASWIVSKEGFMAGMQHFMPFFKLRFSWGKVGNDGVINDPRFVHLTEITEVQVPSPRPDEMMNNKYEILNYMNPTVTWEIAEQYNFGVDFKLFNELIEVNADAYQEIRHNVLSYRTTMPASVGLFQPPLDNIGKVKSQGIDLAAKMQHAFSNDFWFILNGTFTYNKATFMEIEEATNKPEWQRKKGREISQQFGYVAEGVFQDQAEINNAAFQGGDVQPGDIRYRDINGDGKIDVFDAVPIGYPETPRIIYGFSAFIHYKGLELNLAFQGSGNRAFFLNPTAISPFYQNNAVLKAIADDHWSPENANLKPLWPRLSVDNIVKHNPEEDYNSGAEIRKSTYFMKSGRFLRCQSIELAYNLPRSVVKKVAMKNIKAFARVNNPFIITPFKLWDIELGENGFNYPIQKTYSVGLNISF